MRKYLLAFSALILYTCLNAQTITFTPFASGFNTPIGVEFAPGDNRMYVVQQRGRIRIVNTNGTVVPTDFLNISSLVSATGNERGLLGLAFHPDYATNGYLFVNYTRASNGATRISRFTRDSGNPNIADPTSEVVLLEIPQPFSNHNGGCIRFGHDGYLYIGMGDGGDAGDPGNRAENPQQLLGKMLRIDVNAPTYTVPLSNPYYGHTDTLPEIWAMGVRNPWRYSFDRLTGDLWIADVGQNAWEEINFQPANWQGGANYGWRCYEGNVAYNTAGCQPQSFYDSPVAVYSHAGGSCSVTGGYVYRGAQEGDLYGKFLYVDYCSGDIRVTYPNGSGGWITNALNSPNNAFVAFGEDHQGELYAADGNNGTVYRIATTLCQPTAAIWGQGGVHAICNGASLQLSTPDGPGFSYQWMVNNGNIGGATNDVYTATTGGNYQVIVEDSTGCRDTSAVFTVTTSANPNVSLSVDTTLCLNAGTVQLNGTPAGGSFSGGTGVGNGVFYPAVAGVGTALISYTYQDPSTGCTATATRQVEVFALPNVSFTGLPTSSCLDDASLTLTGTPSGGTFTGAGVTGTTFDPLSAGVGTHTVIYNYADANGCSNADSATVTVSDCNAGVEGAGEIGQWNIYPNPAIGQANLQIHAVQNMDVTIRLVSVDGKVVSVFNKTLAAGENIIALPLQGMAQGLYQVQLTGKRTWVRPLVIME